MRRRLPPWTFGVLIALAFLAAYARTLAPTVLPDDAGEMQVLDWALGLGHSIGYPLYLGVSHLLSHGLILWGEPAYRMNLVSALFGALSLGLFYALTFSLCPGRTWARTLGSAAAALVLGYSYTLWSVSIVAEMYTLQLLLSLTVFFFLSRWDRGEGNRSLAAAGFVFGLMFGNHASTIALAPALLAAALLGDARKGSRLRLLAVTAASALLGLLLGDVLPFWLIWRRHLPYDVWNGVFVRCADLFPDDRIDGSSFWSAWRFCIRSRQVADGLFHPREGFVAAQLAILPLRFIAELSPLVAISALLGAWKGSASRRMDRILLIAALSCCLSTLAYSMTDKTRIYLLNAFAVAALYAGVFVSRWADAGRRRSPFVWAAALALIALNYGLTRPAAAALARERPGLFEVLIPAGAPHPDLHEDRRTRDEALAFVDKLEPDAIVFTNWWGLYPIEYVARFVKGWSGLEVCDLTPSAGTRSGRIARYYQDAIETRNVHRRPVYFIGHVPDAYRAQARPISPGLWRLE